MPAYKGDDGRWRYRFAFRGRRYSGSTAKGMNTKRAAELLERAHLDKLEKRRFTGLMPNVRDFVAQFLEHQRAHTKQLTYELNESVMRVHVLPELGELAIDEVNRETIDKLKAAWLESAAPTTVNTRLGVLLRMLSLAVEWEILPAVPAVKFLRVARERIRFLSDEESTRLIEAAGINWRTMVVVGLRTGLRIGELRGLQWIDINLHQGAVHVMRTDPGRSDVEPNSPKGGRDRVVPLTDETVASLQAWSNLTFTRSRPSNAWVFPGVGEKTRAEGNCNEQMGRIAARAKVADCTWHTLRHTYASQLVMRGVPLRAVQDLLGHASIKQTERYAHLAPGYTNRAMVASLDVPLLQLAPKPGDAES